METVETVETVTEVVSLSRLEDKIAVSIEEKCDGDSGDRLKLLSPLSPLKKSAMETAK